MNERTFFWTPRAHALTSSWTVSLDLKIFPNIPRSAVSGSSVGSASSFEVVPLVLASLYSLETSLLRWPMLFWADKPSILVC
jgi:hypothetical protein